MWVDFFKKTDDSFNNSYVLRVDLHDEFFKMEWYCVYDLIEFICEWHEHNSLTHKGPMVVNRPTQGHYIFNVNEFVKECNRILEREASIWRVVGTKITRITSEKEISEVSKATCSPINEVNRHVTRAMSLLYDRDEPDYRNSVKESISAVEAICTKIAKQKTPILSTALDAMEKQKIIEFPKAMKAAFEKMYGYTSSQSGIRHALINDKDVTLELAQFFLIACSAFINYLVATSTKNGINLKELE